MRNSNRSPLYFEDRPLFIARMVLHHRFVIHLLLEIVMGLAIAAFLAWHFSGLHSEIREQKTLETDHFNALKEQGKDILKKIELVDAWRREEEIQGRHRTPPTADAAPAPDPPNQGN